MSQWRGLPWWQRAELDELTEGQGLHGTDSRLLCAGRPQAARAWIAASLSSLGLPLDDRARARRLRRFSLRGRRERHAQQPLSARAAGGKLPRFCAVQVDV